MTGIATILHRSTLAALVGTRTFDRGEACFAEGRVLATRSGRGELRGTVRPKEHGRPPYAVRIWVRAEGFAVECSCPMGEQQQFCKHAVAVALAHLSQPRRAEAPNIHDRLHAVDHGRLVDALLARASDTPALHAMLLSICDDLDE